MYGSYTQEKSGLYSYKKSIVQKKKEHKKKSWYHRSGPIVLPPVLFADYCNDSKFNQRKKTNNDRFQTINKEYLFGTPAQKPDSINR